MKQLLLGIGLTLSVSALAELPEDLKKFKDHFATIVVDPALQGDYEIGWEELNLGEDESLHIKKIIKKEVAGPDVDEEDTYAIESIAVNEVKLSSDSEAVARTENNYTPASLAKEIYGNVAEGQHFGPFYCGALKINAESESPFANGCEAETRKLMDKILELKLPLAYAKLKGNWWGSYEHKALYVQSAIDPKQWVRLYFDILHEI